MTARKALNLSLVGLVIAVLSFGALYLAHASGQPKPTVAGTLALLGSVSGLIVMVVGLIVLVAQISTTEIGQFLGKLFAVFVGAIVGFYVGAVVYLDLDHSFSAPGYGLMGRDELGTSHEESPIVFGFLAAIGCGYLASVLWDKIRKVRPQCRGQLPGGRLPPPGEIAHGDVT